MNKINICAIFTLCLFQNMYAAQEASNEIFKDQGSEIVIDISRCQGGSFEMNCADMSGQLAICIVPLNSSTMVLSQCNVDKNVYVKETIEKLILKNGSRVLGNIIFQGERSAPGIVELLDTSSIQGQIVNGIVAQEGLVFDLNLIAEIDS
ncbi:MAG TPA: hypothetical protein VLG50_02675 [Candidatus Saccharimonadales bacterium]|nr:hypothetical protein [Candidatus Saccharimonadales bacterium]